MSNNNNHNNSNKSVPGGNGTPRIQISLNKEQRKAIAKAVTPAAAAKSNNNNKSIEAMISSSPGLYKSVRKALKNQTLNFKVNAECTSLKVSPSGNFLWGGFSDGTLRVWDLSGTFAVEDDDVVASRQKSNLLVNSKLTQGYGAVACQIHARGVHTDLLTTVDVSDDAQYVFMGVSRGAMELHAVFVGDLERAVHKRKQREQLQGNPLPPMKRNILDYLKVYCHSDAKLKGFGACARLLEVSKTTSASSTSSSYLLLTGKGIKNIHIWKFVPPKHPNYDSDLDKDDKEIKQNRNRKQSICDPPEDEQDHGIWDQLYDTSTNGNTIVLLGFYRSPQGKLLAVSKSDAQKLRLWDLSFEENLTHTTTSSRPKRPPYQDVENSQSALEIAGGIGVCGGGNMYNEMSIVSLDRPKDPYNHTELALPSGNSNNESSGYSSRRQRRGEMKAVVNVATSQRDSNHALLELDDGSLVGYSAGSGGGSTSSGGSIPKLTMVTPERTGIPSLPADFWRRCICLANISGVVIAASSLYNPNTNKGQLVVRALGGLKKPRGSEIAELKKKRKMLKQQQEQEKQRERQQLQTAKEQQQASLTLQKKEEAVIAAAPKTPSPIHAINNQPSPIAADSQALKDAVSAPTTTPAGVVRSDTTEMQSTTTTVSEETPNKTSCVAKASTRVSPSNLETPRSPPKSSATEASSKDESPDSTEKLPKISQFLQPKRINPEENSSKKRKSATTTNSEPTATAPKPLPKTNESPVGMFQLNNIGSIPFKSPKPQSKKAKRASIVKAPSKPKRSLSSNSLEGTSGRMETKRSRTELQESSLIATTPKMARTTDDVSTAIVLTSLAKQSSPVVASELAAKKLPANQSQVIPDTAPQVMPDREPKAPVKPSSNARVDSKKAIASPSETPNTTSGKASSTTKTVADSKPSAAAKSASKTKTTTTVPHTQPQVQEALSREAILNEKIHEQYKQLKVFLKNFTTQSMNLIHSRNLRGPVPSALVGSDQRDRRHLDAYSKLLEEHRAAHDYLQRRLLKAAETTLFLLKESRITSEEARSELKQSIKKFEGILYDTLRRQQMERMALVSRHPNSVENLSEHRQATSTTAKKGATKQTPYPCQAAFEKVEDICAAITRPVGRPRSTAGNAPVRS